VPRLDDDALDLVAGADVDRSIAAPRSADRATYLGGDLEFRLLSGHGFLLREGE
jgi:hypothetical protein